MEHGHVEYEQEWNKIISRISKIINGPKLKFILKKKLKYERLNFRQTFNIEM